MRFSAICKLMLEEKKKVARRGDVRASIEPAQQLGDTRNLSIRREMNGESLGASLDSVGGLVLRPITMHDDLPGELIVDPGMMC